MTFKELFEVNARWDSETSLVVIRVLEYGQAVFDDLDAFTAVADYGHLEVKRFNNNLVYLKEENTHD